MGMSRDEALKVWLPIIQMGVETMPECKEALDMAVDTMRKYQKIEEIVKNTQYLCSYGSAFIDIREVVEDGNDN